MNGDDVGNIGQQWSRIVGKMEQVNLVMSHPAWQNRLFPKPAATWKVVGGIGHIGEGWLVGNRPICPQRCLRFGRIMPDITKKGSTDFFQGLGVLGGV